jgi:hypothetical protein
MLLVTLDVNAEHVGDGSDVVVECPEWQVIRLAIAQPALFPEFVDPLEGDALPVTFDHIYKPDVPCKEV